MRTLVACAAILTATWVLAQVPSKIEIEGRQGGYNWVVETAADGSRRGGWVPISIPLENVDRGLLKSLPPVDDRARTAQTSSGLQLPSGVQTSGSASREDQRPSQNKKRGGAQVLEVQIVDRHASETNYSYVVPGHLTSQTNSSANCFGLGNSVNCSGSSTTHATATSPSSPWLKGLPTCGRTGVRHDDPAHGLTGDRRRAWCQRAPDPGHASGVRRSA
jgi:hypothetical protein